MDCSLPDSSLHGILQARILESFPSPGDLPDPGIKPMSPESQADSLLPEPPRKPLLPPQKINSTLFQVCQKKKKKQMKCGELTSSFFFNFPSHFSRVGKISMLTSVTKTFFSPFYSPEPMFPAMCSDGNCDLNSYQQCHIKTKRCERMQKRRKWNNSLTNNSNNSSLKPPKFLLQRKCQSC